MGGVSIRQARDSLDRALRHLRPQDQFNIIAFNSSHRSLFRNSVPANRHNVLLATEFVRHLQASGGTEMMSALQAALSPVDSPDELNPRPALRQIIFITDGAVGNESQLFTEIAGSLGHSTLFTVGIGSAPNSWFMRKAAEFGRGSFTYIGDVAEVGEKMDRLFRHLSNPIASDLSVEWPDGAEAWPARMPDLYQGDPLLVAVKFPASFSERSVTVSGLTGHTEWQKTLQLPVHLELQNIDHHSGVASLWARKKIAGLLDERHSGREESWLRAQVLPLALQHSLLSPYTSFVAVEERPVRPADKKAQSKALPNTRPRGQSPQAFAYPNTATSAAANVWLGSFLLLVALFVRAVREGEDNA
jgi:Ca-activated chloride channel family protein